MLTQQKQYTILNTVKSKGEIQMAVRKRHNRAKTEPWGKDYMDVVKRAKAFFKDGTFYVTKYEDLFFAWRPSVAYGDPYDAVYYTKVGHRWIKRGN